MREKYLGKTTEAKPKKNKYNNVKVTIGDLKFDSKKEASRFLVLKQLEQLKLIENLRLQVRYELKVNDFRVCFYIADFVYFDCQLGKEIIEDTKGVKTDVYRLKKKLMKACLNIEIKET